MNPIQRVLLVLFIIPVALAHYYSLETSPLSVLFSLASLTLLIYASTCMLGRIEAGSLRTAVGLISIYLLSFYYASLFISYYLQGSYFNQQYYFHSNLTTLIESGAAYLPLAALTVAWTACVLATFYYFRKRLPQTNFSLPILAGLFIVGLGLDPGLRPAAISGVNAALRPSIDSLDAVDFEELDLNASALRDSQPSAVAGKNLLLIFLEGLENIYTDEDIFPGLTPNLNALGREGLRLNNMQKVEGSGWTMAGLVSSLCGTPLLYESNLSGNEVLFSRLLDRTTCLGDVLDSAGYKQVFMGGASLQFAGKGGFLREHGFGNVLGREALLQELDDPTYVNGWGLYDDSLFSLALERFEDLAASGQPFNLTLLTVDTHHPTGEPSASCSDFDGIDNSILHAVHCTDFLLGNFIEQIKQHPAYEDTLVVMVSDHLAMRNDAFSLFPSGYQRNLYFTVLNADAHIDPQVFATPPDIAPTVLNLLNTQHDAAFLAGIDLLNTEPEAAQRDTYNPERMDAIRYINSNHLSTAVTNTVYAVNRLALREIEYSLGIIDIDYSGGALRFNSSNDDPYFLLPQLASVDYDEAALHITLDAAERLAVTIYYEEIAGQGYSEENTLRREIEPGINRLVFELRGIADDSRIRIDPGHVPGRYTIHELEIRSE